MKKGKIIDITGLVVAGLFFLLSLFLFYRDTAMFFDSLIAALIAAGLVWATYIILRVCILAMKRQDK